MKRKLLIIPVLAMLSIVLLNCSKDCEPGNPTCYDVPDMDQPCNAYFTRWYYNQAKNKCEEKGMSGCTPNGFATQQECEECKCR